MITDLSPYGSGIGFSTWSLDDTIAGLQEEVADKYVGRARGLLAFYAPFDITKANGVALLTELIYYTAEQLYYRGLSQAMLFSPFKSERIGSYAYDKGNRDRSSILNIISENEIIWGLVTYLQKMPLLAISTRVIREMPFNPDTGIRDVVLTHSDRITRAIERASLVSDTEDFNMIVYGDRYTVWDWALPQ